MADTTSSLAGGARALLLRGAEKTGKTERLVQRTAELVAHGADPVDILVLAATPDAARVLRHRLAKTEESLAAVEVTVPRAFALDVLATPEAQAFTGRKARMLARYEESFLMEDMKVTGMRPGRINGLVHFFYRGWTELSDGDDDWLIFAEERETHELLRRLLAAYGAFLEPEISNTAVRFLAADEDARAKASRRHVLVDDYQHLSRASQHLANLVAADTLTVAANPASASEVYESYPYPAGVDELMEAYDGLVVEELEASALPAGTVAALERLGALSIQMAAENKAVENGKVLAPSPANAAPVPPDELAIVACKTPAAECERVGLWAEAALEAGARPADLAIVVPNRTWERNIARRLTAVDIPVRKSTETSNIGGDVRYRDLCRAAQVATLIMLAADPADAAALRAWCGFGDYLTCRALFSELLPTCQDGVPLASLLAQVHEGAQNGTLASDDITYRGDVEKMSARLTNLAEALASLQGLTGKTLIQQAAAAVEVEGATDVPAIIAGLARELPADADADAVAATLWSELTCPALADTDGVALVTADRTVGLEATQVAASGLVNGCAPVHAFFDRTKSSPEKARTLLSRCAESYRPALALGENGATLLSFSTVRATDAERLGLSVSRFFIENGTRQARVARSLLIDCIEGEAITVE